jgi:hypothetical protein
MLPMSSTTQPRRKSATRIIVFVLMIFFIGNFIAASICYLQPKIYESTGSFTEWAPPDQTIPVAGAHAATIVSSLQLHLRWGIPFEDAIQLVRDKVTIETSATETTIRARFSSAQDARLIVEALMKNFPGFERERQWAQIEGVDGRYTEREEETGRQIGQLKQAMFLTLKQAGHHIPGSLISATTVARLGNEDLSRQFKAYQKMNNPVGRFGPADGNILIPLPIAKPATEAMKAISPDIDKYFLVGRIASSIAAIASLLIIFRYKPTLLETPAQKTTTIPSWASVAENETSDRLSW